MGFPSPFLPFSVIRDSTNDHILFTPHPRKHSYLPSIDILAPHSNQSPRHQLSNPSSHIRETSHFRSSNMIPKPLTCRRVTENCRRLQNRYHSWQNCSRTYRSWSSIKELYWIAWSTTLNKLPSGWRRPLKNSVLPKRKSDFIGVITVPLRH